MHDYLELRPGGLVGAVVPIDGVVVWASSSVAWLHCEPHTAHIEYLEIALMNQLNCSDYRQIIYTGTGNFSYMIIASGSTCLK